nr:hypothetical protein [Tanacetum cinerariifolium]
MTLLNPQWHVVPTAVLTKSKLVPINVARLITAVVLKPHVTRLRQAKTIVTKPHSPPRRNINRSPSPKASTFPPKVTAAKALMVNAVKGNMSYMSDFEELNGGYVSFGGNLKGGKISGKGKIRKGKLDFDDVYFVKELNFNLFSVSQMCDKKNIVLFTDTECLVLSPDFKLPDENQVLLRVPREKNMYNVDLKNIVPSGDLTCNLVRGLPTKVFENDHTCVACKKGKQHRASFVTDDYSRFTWVFFLATKDETSSILKTFITGIENQLSLKAEAVNTACYIQNMVLVTKPQNKTPYELLLGRTPIIGFMRPFGYPVTILNTLDPLGKFDGKVDEGFLVRYSVSCKAFRNTDDDAAFRGKEPEFKGRKPKSEVHVSSSSSAQIRKHDDKTKREVKGNSLVESLTGYRNLSAEFEDFSDNSINEVNAADSLVPTVGQIFTNSTNTFSVAGPSNAADERGIVVKNKARLVAQGHTLEEGIDYEEVFALVERIEATRLSLAYASFMGFMVYQMDVKSAFLYGTIEEDVYVCQPPGFEDPDYPDKRGKIDHTLFIKRQQGELTFFLGLQVKQKPDGIFISQDKYVVEILRKFRLIDEKSASTPIDTEKPLLKDPDGEDVDVHTYKSMIGSLMYLTSS